MKTKNIWICKFNGNYWEYPKKTNDFNGLKLCIESFKSLKEDNGDYFHAPSRNTALTEREKRNLKLTPAKKIDLEKLIKAYNKRFHIKDETYDNSSINNLNKKISDIKPYSIKIKLNDDDALRLKNRVNEIDKSLNIENALTLIKYSLKHKISQMIGDTSIDSSEMEDARCLLFSLDDVEKFLNKK
jgi:hypothetical protein